jgi:hypothetical protein
MADEQMISRCVCVIAAMASFSVNAAIVQAPIGASFRGNVTDQASLNSEQPDGHRQKSGPTAAPEGRQSAVRNFHERPFHHARAARRSTKNDL